MNIERAQMNAFDQYVSTRKPFVGRPRFAIHTRPRSPTGTASPSALPPRLQQWARNRSHLRTRPRQCCARKRYLEEKVGRTDWLKHCASAVATVPRVRIRRVRSPCGVKVPAPLLQRANLSIRVPIEIPGKSDCDDIPRPASSSGTLIDAPAPYPAGTAALLPRR